LDQLITLLDLLLLLTLNASLITSFAISNRGVRKRGWDGIDRLE
jgi:hypothetical protein